MTRKSHWRSPAADLRHGAELRRRCRTASNPRWQELQPREILEQDLD